MIFPGVSRCISRCSTIFFRQNIAPSPYLPRNSKFLSQPTGGKSVDPSSLGNGKVQIFRLISHRSALHRNHGRLSRKQSPPIGEKLRQGHRRTRLRRRFYSNKPSARPYHIPSIRRYSSDNPKQWRMRCWNMRWVWIYTMDTLFLEKLRSLKASTSKAGDKRKSFSTRYTNYLHPAN
jgi:hypothetical protein